MNNIKYKYSLTFQKKGLLIFLSHLDLMRLFARVLQKSELPLVYTQGFNPHLRYALPYPLPVGYTGTAEVLEIYLTAPVAEQTLVSALNAHLPADIKILSAVFGTLSPEYYLRVILEKESKLPADWPKRVLEKTTKRNNVLRYCLGEHIRLEIKGQELLIYPLSAQIFKAEKICALLDIPPDDIIEIIRVKKEAV